MKIIKITSLGCSSCIIMNNIFEEVLKEYKCNIKNYDYDFDEEEVEKHNVGNILPVIIFLDKNNNEKFRIIGEKSKSEVIEIINKYINE